MPQYFIKDAELENLYACIQGLGNTTEALMLLSKPVDQELSRDRVYNDYLILTLTDEQVEALVTSIAEEDQSASTMLILARNVKSGLVVREDEDEDFGPGDFGHPLNEDGTARQEIQIEGYCVACTLPRNFDGYIVISESGRRMVNGGCPVCNTKMNKILD